MDKSPAVARTTSLCLAEIGRDCKCKDEGLLKARPCPRLILSELDIFMMLLNELNVGTFRIICLKLVGTGEVESDSTQA